MRIEQAKLEESLRAQECSLSTFVSSLSHVSLTCLLDSKTAHLERTIQELGNKLADSQRAANQKVYTLNETIKLLGASDKSSSACIFPLTHISLKFTSIR
jgi:uncharacterized coiled-coil protein SlyX